MDTIAPGHYEINFTAQLPSDIPSSFYYKDKSEKPKPKMKVGYYIEASFKGFFADHKMSHRKVLIIREKPEQLTTFKKFT